MQHYDIFFWLLEIAIHRKGSQLKFSGNWSGWGAEQLEASFCLFVQFLTGSYRWNKESSSAQVIIPEFSLYGSPPPTPPPPRHGKRTVLSKCIPSQRGANTMQGSQWNWYRCLHLQPAPPISSLLFSPPTLGLAPSFVLTHKALANSYHHPPPLSQQRGWEEQWEGWLEAFWPRGIFIPV